MSSSPTLVRPLFGLGLPRTPETELLKTKEKKKKIGIEVSRGNRLKKEKRWKDLDALAQSSLAFNPCVHDRGGGRTG